MSQLKSRVVESMREWRRGRQVALLRGSNNGIRHAAGCLIWPSPAPLKHSNYWITPNCSTGKFKLASIKFRLISCSAQRGAALQGWENRLWTELLCIVVVVVWLSESEYAKREGEESNNEWCACHAIISPRRLFKCILFDSQKWLTLP